MDRILDIETNGRHLSKFRGFIKISEDKTEIGRVALDDVSAVIIHAHGITWSHSLLTELAERGIITVLCAQNHMPTAILWPLQGNHIQGERMRAQWQTRLPVFKNMWRDIVAAKITMQAAVLQASGCDEPALASMAKYVKSGDSGNLEAQAARLYWPRLLGDGFRRDRNAEDLNALLNYGYTVLRAATARAVVAAGLNPTIGLHHHNRGNAFALVDDLIEPFRPLVDCTVLGLHKADITEVNKEAKQVLVGLIALDLPIAGNRSPVMTAIHKLAHSVAESFVNNHVALQPPWPPASEELAHLMMAA